MERKIGYAVVGLGVGKQHAKAAYNSKHGKLIAVCDLLEEKLKEEGHKVARISFPMYETPSGRIVGACLLGKSYLCAEYLKENHSFFPEGGGKIDALAALCYYAADRRYNLPIIEKYLQEGYLILVKKIGTNRI